MPFASCRPSKADKVRAGPPCRSRASTRRADRTISAIQFLKKALPGYYSVDLPALPRPYWEILFPRPYWTDVQRQAMANSLDPYLVASLIRQESEFNPAAQSRTPTPTV